MIPRINNRGFTIVELLIVVVVIAILAAITIVAFNGIQQRAQNSAIQSTISQAAKKLEIYKADVGVNTYPVDVATGGISFSADYTYFYERSASLDSFCLVLMKNTLSYVVTNDNLSPRTGGCVPANGLVGSWTFNNNANDTSGSNMNGTVVGATPVTGENGQANGAYSFNGTSNYISLATTAPLNFATGQFSVSAWVNLATLPAVSTWYDILSSTGGGDWSFGINATAAGVGRSMMTKVSQTDSPAGPTVDQNTWKLVTAVYTYGPAPSTVGYYLDGVLSSTVNWNHSAQGSFTPATKRIGSRNATGYFRGSIDDIKVYSRALSAPEISSMFAAGAQ